MTFAVRKKSCGVVACLAIFLTVIGLLTLPAFGKVRFKPDPKIQQAIHRFSASDYAEGGEDLYEGLKLLRDSVDGDYRKLAPELVYFTSRSTSTREAMVEGVVIMTLPLYDAIIVPSLLPYVEAEEEKFREEVRQTIMIHDHGFFPTVQEFEYAMGPIKNAASKGEPPPEDLVRFLYKTRAHIALLEMAMVYQGNRKALMWSEHVVSEAMWRRNFGFEKEFQEAKPEAIAELEKLSQNEEWWVRLYVAEMLQNNPEFRTPEMMERLKNDKHKLVREAITRKPRKDSSKNPKGPVQTNPPAAKGEK